MNKPIQPRVITSDINIPDEGHKLLRGSEVYIVNDIKKFISNSDKPSIQLQEVSNKPTLAEQQAMNVQATANTGEQAISSNVQLAGGPAMMTEEDIEKKIEQASKTEKTKGIGCLYSSVGLVFFIILLIVFITPRLSDLSVGGPLGGDMSSLYDLLIRIGFLIIGFVGFIVIFLGVFVKAGIKKKDPIQDKATRKYGNTLIYTGGVLIFGSVLTGIFYGSTLSALFNVPVDKIDFEIVTEPVETTGSAPMDVEFKIDRTPNMKTINWDLGDGTKDKGGSITHRYVAIGEFTVRADVELQDGKILKSQKIITVNNIKPKAKAEASPMSGPGPLDVSFDGGESTDDKGIVKYEWLLGGGVKLDGPNVNYTFNEPGQYTVELRVTDDKGDISSDKITVNVEDRGRPKADFIVTPPTNTLNAPAEIRVDASPSSDKNGNIVKYGWTFGDGEDERQVFAKSATHTYKKGGTYLIKLEVTDNDGLVDTKTIKYLVNKALNKPKADFDMPKGDIMAPVKVTFDGNLSKDDGGVVSYLWKIDGEIAGEGDIFSYNFIEPKVYDITLVVGDDVGLQDQITKQITILSAKPRSPVPSIKLNPNPASITIGDFMEFDASSSYDPDGTIISYKWDFGDGFQEQGGSPKIKHRYNKVGIFKVKLTVIDNTGMSSTEESLVAVNNVLTKAIFTYRPKALKSPVKVEFDASPSQGSISSYYWDFGDGGTATERAPGHVYNEPGIYEVVLRVTDSSGQQSEEIQTIKIE